MYQPATKYDDEDDDDNDNNNNNNMCLEHVFER